MVVVVKVPVNSCGDVSFGGTMESFNKAVPRKEGYPSMAPRPGPPPEISKRIPGLRPGIPWTEIRPASGRRKNAPAFGRGRLAGEKIAGTSKFVWGKTNFVNTKNVIFEFFLKDKRFLISGRI